MTALFEALFKYRPLVYEKGTLAFRPPWPWPVTLFLAVAACLGAYLVYRSSATILPGRWRGLLTGLRAAFLLVLLLIFLQPVLILHSVVPQKSFVAVLYDLSKSMEIHDEPGGLSRLDIEKNLLRSTGGSLPEALAKRFKVRFFRFSAGAERATGFADIPHHGNVTDVGRSLEQVTAELGGVPLSGVVLITDGADNHSADLAGTAARLKARNIPVYPVGIGTPDFSRDMEVLRVSVPRRALKNAMVEADVSVRSSGFAGRRAKLVVKERERLLQSQEITLGSDGEVKNYRINFTCDSAGARVFTVGIEPFPGEILKENNDQTVLIRVVDEQPPILYVEGEPRWIYGFLRRAALEDKNLHLVTLLRQADGKFLRQGVDTPSMLERGFPADKSELFRYKALILGSVEASFFTFDQLRMISDFVSQRGGGFLMLGGRHSFGQGGYINTPLEDLLPLSLRPGSGAVASMDFQDVEFKARLTGYGTDHPVTRLSPTETENRKRWDSAPGLVGLNPTGGAKPGATVLLQCALPDARSQTPALLAVQRFGRGRSAALTTASTWRWRMELDYRDNFHELFWKQMLRWLVSDAPDPVNVDPEKLTYSPEEAVALHADVNDASFLKVNNAQVVAQVKAPSGQITPLQLSWDVSRDGQYSATFRPQEMGTYEVSAEASRAGRSLGSAKTNFLVADTTEEFHNAALNSDLLRRLASDTGGRYYSSGEARNLAEDISYVDNGTSRIEEKELWDLPFLFLLLISTAGAEWALRKRKGLA